MLRTIAMASLMVLGSSAGAWANTSIWASDTAQLSKDGCIPVLSINQKLPFRHDSHLRTIRMIEGTPGVLAIYEDSYCTNLRAAFQLSPGESMTVDVKVKDTFVYASWSNNEEANFAFAETASD